MYLQLSSAESHHLLRQCLLPFYLKPCVRFYVGVCSSVQPYLHSHSNSLLNVAVGRVYVVVVVVDWGLVVCSIRQDTIDLLLFFSEGEGVGMRATINIE